MRNKRYSISKIPTFIPPLCEERQEEMQITYVIYLNSFVSLIKYINEIDKNFVRKVSSLFGDTYDYIRELRNSVVHRGLDLTRGAGNINGSPFLVPFLPEYVTSYKGKKICNPFNNFLDLIITTEKINNLVCEFCKANHLFDDEEINTLLLKYELEDNSNIPEGIKSFFQKTSSESIFDQLKNGVKDKFADDTKKYFDTSDLTTAFVFSFK